LKNRYFPAKHLSGHLDNEGKPMDRIVFNRLSRFASSSWRPRPLDASGVLFRTKLPGEEMLPGFDLTYGWRDLFTRGLEIVHIAGNHSSMVVDENLAELARQINPVLDRCNLVKVNPNGDVSNKA
jgi:thioesterase domain-containing protein